MILCGYPDRDVDYMVGMVEGCVMSKTFTEENDFYSFFRGDEYLSSPIDTLIFILYQPNIALIEVKICLPGSYQCV
jgi:hypothetical protein